MKKILLLIFLLPVVAFLYSCGQQSNTPITITKDQLSLTLPSTYEKNELTTDEMLVYSHKDVFIYVEGPMGSVPIDKWTEKNTSITVLELYKATHTDCSLHELKEPYTLGENSMVEFTSIGYNKDSVEQLITQFNFYIDNDTTIYKIIVIRNSEDSGITTEEIEEIVSTFTLSI